MLLINKSSKSNLLKQLYNDPERKPILIIIKEIIILFFYYRTFPKHYFARYLFKKGKKNIKDYYPDSYLYANFKPQLNNQNLRHYVEDKLFFNMYYAPFSIPMPKIFIYNYKSKFIVGNSIHNLNTLEEFTQFLIDAFDNYKLESIFIKPFYKSYGGDRVYKLMKSQLNNDSSFLNKLFNDVLNAGFIFQESVVQHSEMAKLNPASVNTIRFETFINNEGLVKIVSAYLRISIKDSYVDNISSGGCQVSINLENGKLKEIAYSTFSNVGVKVFTEHPKTNIKFDGFQIPYFSEAKELVIKIASIMPGLRLIGWDVAIGKNGPLIIEGNSDYDMSGNDLSENGYKSNSIFREILKEVGKN